MSSTRIAHDYQPLFPIGTQYTSRIKIPKGYTTKLCTVRNVWHTYDMGGRLVRVRYVVSYEFGGQPVMDYDVVEMTIAIALNGPVQVKPVRD